jgi:hypothetical protein
VSEAKAMKPKTEKTYGVLGQFDGPNELLAAGAKTRDAGYKNFDCHSPFPIHGMDQAMGLTPSKIGYIAGICGIIGGTGGFYLQYWTSAIAYPMVIAGKPYNAYPAFVPVTFGLTILLAAFGAFFGSMIANKLPQWFHGVFYSERFARVTTDGFFVSIDSDDPKFDADKDLAFLKSIGATYVEVLKGE